MENLIEELRFQNGMESKWKWIGTGMENLIKIKWNGMEMEWK